MTWKFVGISPYQPPGYHKVANERDTVTHTTMYHTQIFGQRSDGTYFHDNIALPSNATQEQLDTQLIVARKQFDRFLSTTQ